MAGALPPQKAYFKIGEAARLVGVPAYVLRYWETEFETLRPEKSRSNQRVYGRQDLEMLRGIKRLLYEEGLTIVGARRALRHGGRPRAAAEERSRTPPRLAQALRQAREQTEKLLGLLRADERDDPEGD